MGNHAGNHNLEAAYQLARERYEALGVNTDAALQVLRSIPISLHCWQGDDVGGFEDPERGLSGGIMATGNYPGKARTIDELRSDLDLAYRLNLHAIYLETAHKVERNAIRPEHFSGWVDWARANKHGIDVNPCDGYFDHPDRKQGSLRFQQPFKRIVPSHPMRYARSHLVRSVLMGSVPNECFPNRSPQDPKPHPQL